ncbi:hypothetical protein NDS46_30875 (plasmid) [Paenibacillus thiaminolyticus]|uniref:hypothetical protein n=1 Tax=Paenibacillus thiaminolyticus TaxID=49283 RepID=UPI00232E9C03|nr:hypothetical protein [Paenibacillus thiaminolyticus]WCF11751.1 hypothetical protein NDS46_30875 [Paenibacillus thiaminolyticus]
MSWNFRIVKKKLNQDEDTYDVCEVYYDEKGNPISYAPDKNVLSHYSFKDLQWAYKEIKKAYNKPVLEDIGDNLIELAVCPQCNKEIGYSTIDLMGDGVAEDFGKTVLVCPLPKGCGYLAVKQETI